MRSEQRARVQGQREEENESDSLKNNIALLVLLAAIALVAVTVMSYTNSASIVITANIISRGCGCMPIIAVSPSWQKVQSGDIIAINSVVISPGCGCVASDTYQWYNDTTGTPVLIAGANTLNFRETAGAIGTFEYYVTISDSFHANQSNIATVKVVNQGCGCPSSTTSTTTATTTTTTTTTSTATTVQQSYGGFVQTGGGLPLSTSTTIGTTTTVGPSTTAATTSSTSSTTVPPTITIAPQVAPSSTSTIPVTITGSYGKSGGIQPMLSHLGTMSLLWLVIALFVIIILLGMVLLLRNRKHDRKRTR